MRSRFRGRWLALVAGSAAFIVLLPGALIRPLISEDAVEYLAIAHNWVEGHGFVNPIMLAFVLEGATPPLPAIATRGPVLPILLSLPLSLGASLQTLGLLHIALAASVVAGLFLVARRLMSSSTALGCALAFGWSLEWWRISQAIVTEAVAVGAVLLAIATVAQVGRSVPRAIGCAAIPILGWLTRPNLVLLGVVVAGAVAWDLGRRRALGSWPLRAYLTTFAGAYLIISLGHQIATGFSPYAQYSVLTWSFSVADLQQYHASSGRWIDFLWEHRSEVWISIGRNLRGLGGVLLGSSSYNLVGWLALPALVRALRSGNLELRTCALAALVLLLPILLMYGPNDPGRYAVTGVVALWLVAASWIETVAGAASRTKPARRLSARFPWVPRPQMLAGVSMLILASLNLPRMAELTLPLYERSREQGQIHLLGPWDAAARFFCSAIEPGAVVAAGPSPWAIHYWCGNPTMWTPNDLRSERELRRFHREHRPLYIILEQERAVVLGDRARWLERVAHYQRWVLYRARRGSIRESPRPLHQLASG
ncbi:MAG: hypothetical protein ABFS46_13865 [Myxococcota bacterium]